MVVRERGRWRGEMTSHTPIDFYVIGSLLDTTALRTTKMEGGEGRGAEIDPQTFCTHQL